MKRSTFAIIGVDPGKTTGLLFFVDGVVKEQLQIAAEDVTPYVRGWLEQLAKTHAQAYTVLAVERFQTGAQTLRASRQPDAANVIGGLTDLAREFGVRMIKQNPGDAKKLGSHDRLRKIGWWKVGQDHANDAASHALLALATCRPGAFASVIGV